MQVEHNGIRWSTRFGVIDDPRYGTIYITELNEGKYLIGWAGVSSGYSEVITMDEPTQRGILKHIEMVELYADS